MSTATFDAVKHRIHQLLYLIRAMTRPIDAILLQTRHRLFNDGQFHSLL